MKKKHRFLLAASVILVVCTSCSSTQKGKSGIELIKQEVEINTRFSDESLFEVPAGETLKIIESDYNPHKTGEYTVKATTESKQDIIDTFRVSVVDTTPPSVTQKNNEITLPLNRKFDWLDYITLSDNSISSYGETKVSDIKFEVDNSTLDIKTKGRYEVSYTAEDPSGNRRTGKLTVVVDESWEKYERIAVKLIQSLKNILKNPDSLQIHSMSCKWAGGLTTCHFKIDYSAQNGFGGMNRSTHYFGTTNGSIGQYDLDSLMMTLEHSIYNSSTDPTYNLDVEKIMNAPDQIKNRPIV